MGPAIAGVRRRVRLLHGSAGVRRVGLMLGLLVACGEPPTAPDVLPTVGEPPARAAVTTADERQPVSVPTAPDDPITSLPLTLLATQVPDDPAGARATIRDHEAGTIANYRSGDPVRKTAIVTAIERGRVILLHDEHRERLDVGREPARIDPDDVFYSDLVDDTLGDTMSEGVQLDSGPGWMIKTPTFAWGTPRTVQRLREALRAYVRVADGGPDVHVGDLSKSGGGPFPPHLSHQAGRDVDIGYVLHGRDADVARFVQAHAGNLDRARSWTLVRALLESRAVAWIFMDYEVQKLLYEQARSDGASTEALETWFQYPRGNRAMQGIIRDWRGHADHFHVRFAQ